MGLTNWSEKGVTLTSDYGSGSSMNSTSSWSSHLPSPNTNSSQRPRSSSYLDLVGGTTTSWDAMEEFRTNGIDSPYCEDDRPYANRAGDLSGTGQIRRTLRQYSCPERIETTTRTRPVSWLPSPTANEFVPRQPMTSNNDFQPQNYKEFNFKSSENLDREAKFELPILDDFPPLSMKEFEEFSPLASSTPYDNSLGMVPAPRPIKRGVASQWEQPFVASATTEEEDRAMRGITPDQLRVLRSLPMSTVRALLSQLKAAKEGAAPQPAPQPAPSVPRRRAENCRFCKNNGEREGYYMSHTLKDARGGIACPVLRAYVCGRCGATGDRAHTAKYCPLATSEDRMKSAAMMRSVRLASGRRRAVPPSDHDQYVLFGETPPTVATTTPIVSPTNWRDMSPLDPAWADLARKLSAL